LLAALSLNFGDQVSRVKSVIRHGDRENNRRVFFSSYKLD